MSVLTITLGNPDSYYESFDYPAGETQVRIKPEWVQDIKTASEIHVICTGAYARSVIELTLLLDALNGLDRSGKLVVFLPYLPYSRADRRFTEGDCFGKDVFLNILDAGGGYDYLVTFDMHSGQGNDELINIHPQDLILRSLVSLNTSKINILYPDEGACDRYKMPFEISSHRGKIELKEWFATKERDEKTGKLSGFFVPPGIANRDPIFIIDDICDGGGTFLGISEKLNELKTIGPKYLYVSHGIFSKGTKNLLMRGNFEKIFTTDSFYQNRYSEKIVTYDVLLEMNKKWKSHII